MDPNFKPYRTGMLTVREDILADAGMAIKGGTTRITSADATAGEK